MIDSLPYSYKLHDNALKKYISVTVLYSALEAIRERNSPETSNEQLTENTTEKPPETTDSKTVVKSFSTSAIPEPTYS